MHVKVHTENDKYLKFEEVKSLELTTGFFRNDDVGEIERQLCSLTFGKAQQLYTSLSHYTKEPSVQVKQLWAACNEPALEVTCCILAEKKETTLQTFRVLQHYSTYDVIFMSLFCCKCVIVHKSHRLRTNRTLIP